MTALWCVECGATTADRWHAVGDQWLCDGCGAKVRDVFTLAAMLGITGVDLLMAVCADD